MFSVYQKITLVCVTFGLVACVSPNSRLESRSPGCETLGADLDYVHESLKTNFSGTTHDPELRRQTEAVFLEERSRVPMCRTKVDAQRSVRRYFAAFHDPHVKAAWNGIARYGSLVETSTGKNTDFIRSFSLAATGIYVVNLGGRYFVRKIDAEKSKNASVELQDELISCEGKSPEKILDQDILPYESVSAKVAAEYRMTPLIFIRWDKLSGSQTNCLFARGANRIQVTLQWQTVPENYLSAEFESPKAEIYQLEKIPRGHWVTLRSFAGYDKDGITQLKQFADDAKKLRDDQRIVVDVRGNTGGNSIWGTRWIENLFGSRPASSTEESFVLSSPGNYAHFNRLHESLAKQGAIQPEDESRWQFLLRAAKESPGKLVKIDTPKAAEKSIRHPGKTFRGTIYVLTDFMVFSSGETFVHELKSKPNVKQVGIATNASTFYSDVRFDITRSGLVFNFPTMVELDREYHRASGQPLFPEIPFSLKPEVEIKGGDSLRAQTLEIKY